MEIKKRYLELDFIKGISIIAVILIHTTAILISQETDEFSQITGIIINQISRFCVPAFLFVAGILAYNSLLKISFISFMKKRIVEIIIPFIFWSTIGLLVWGDISIRNVIITFIFGFGPFHQLYYIPALFQMYLISPFRSKILKSNFSIIVLFILTILLFSFYQISSLNLFGLKESSTINLVFLTAFFSWIFYFSLGLAVGKNYQKVRDVISGFSFRKIIIFLIISISLVLLDSYYNWSFTGEIKSSLLSYFRPVVLIYSISVILFLLKLGILKNQKIIISINDKSFGIYLTHIFVLNIFQLVTNGIFFRNLLGTIFSSLIILVLSFYLCLLLEKLPFRSITLGRSMIKKKVLKEGGI
ncbi:acyltransferase [Paenibacillus sp. FSL K6-3182]|uniref:acyltransferase n=1 Tax=Paenibacillus sp. FSL K6-3182 TaxID=2921495 RepID=UPI0030D3A673